MSGSWEQVTNVKRLILRGKGEEKCVLLLYDGMIKQLVDIPDSSYTFILSLCLVYDGMIIFHKYGFQCTKFLVHAFIVEQQTKTIINVFSIGLFS